MTVAVDKTALIALLRVKGVKWNFVAREAQRPDGLERLLAGHPNEISAEARESAAALEGVELDRHRAEAAEILASTAAEGIRLVTVLDPDYPANLRTIFNLPPFLFYRGDLREDDARAVAVVGTREPSAAGRERAQRLAKLLVESDVTVLSGLAHGIDTAAHTSCLESGGRTIAVLGSGIRRIYPPENEALAESIGESGAVVSQFWPDAAPTRYSFPRRNVVTSGLGQGTVVIEASATSGAKMQARLALEHGKKVFLLRSLVEEHEWARKYLGRGALVVDSVDDILREMRSPALQRERADVRQQLSLAI